MHRNSRGRGGHDRRYRYEGEIHDGDQGWSRSMPRGRPARNDEYNNNMYDDGQPSGEYGRRDRQQSRGRGGYEGDRRHQRDSEEQSSFTTAPWRVDSRSRSRSPGLDPGPPSDTVIVEILPSNFLSDELHQSILNNSPVADFEDVDVRIQSTRGGRRAFIQFASVDEATALVEKYFPRLPMQLPHSTDSAPDGRFEANFHYARSRDEPEDQRKNADNWICSQCNFSNYSTRNLCRECGARPVDESVWLDTLSGGATDAGEQPSHILVVYPILSTVTETELAGDMKRLELEASAAVKDMSKGAPKLKSTAPTENAAGYGARPGSLHRVFLMRTTASNRSARYGFAEFWTVEDADAAMVKFRMLKSFSVAANPATVSRTHMGVFQKEDRRAKPEIEKESFNPLMNPAIRVRYRDPRLYPSKLTVTQEPPEDKSAAQTAGSGATEAKNAISGANDANNAKKRKQEGIPVTPISKKPSFPGHVAMWRRRQDELYGANDASPESSTSISDVNQTPTKASPLKKSVKTDQTPPFTFDLSLSGSPAGPQSAEERGSPEKRGKLPAATDDKAALEKDEVSFIDRDKLMCYICMRKWTKIELVNYHERTDKHKAAMNDPVMVEKAHATMARKKKSSEASSNAPAPQYRDRAKERREAYSQPSMPRQKDEAGSNGPSKPMPTLAKEEKAPKPAQSKGAGMLAKMGWTSGAGLGANGEGRTEAIAMNAYQQGVGLGAEGSNLGDAAQLAEQKTKNDPADYRTMVQEKTRERLKKLG